MASALSAERLAEIQQRAERAMGPDGEERDAARYWLAAREVPALLAEVQRLRQGLTDLAESPDGQEVISADGLRIGGESGGIVHNGSFTAVHEEDLADAIERLLNAA